MPNDRLKMPPERDLGFYQRRKHDKWRAVEPPSPALEAPIADTHAHVHLLPDPLWELERARANNVRSIGEIVDPSEDTLEEVLKLIDAAHDLEGIDMVFSAGVHPHNAKDYTPEIERKLTAALEHPAARVIGEIGLDYHYDFSPRETQRKVFRRQLQLAKKLGLPVALHLRSGEDPTADNAHSEAFEILQEEGLPSAGVLLHCCALAPEELRPWVDAGCYIAYGGALTFKNSDAAREAAHLVPLDQLLLETDSPYMAPEPMRGAACTPAHVIFTAAALADTLGIQPGPARQEFLEQLFMNSERFYQDRHNPAKDRAIS